MFQLSGFYFNRSDGVWSFASTAMAHGLHVLVAVWSSDGCGLGFWGFGLRVLRGFGFGV